MVALFLMLVAMCVASTNAFTYSRPFRPVIALQRLSMGQFELVPIDKTTIKQASSVT
jgi:hypothetical protein